MEVNITEEARNYVEKKGGAATVKTKMCGG